MTFGGFFCHHTALLDQLRNDTMRLPRALSEDKIIPPTITTYSLNNPYFCSLI